MISRTLPRFPVIDGVEFRLLPGWPLYAVTDSGEVWSAKARGSKFGRIDSHWTKRKLSRNSRGYPCLPLSSVGHRPRKGLVHRLVLLAFVGPCPPGKESCHNNGDRTDNRLTNLRYDTAKNNQADRAAHGTKLLGELAPSAKLTTEQVLDIRRRVALGERQVDIANDYEIRDSSVSRIASGKRWSHLDPDAEVEVSR